MDGSINPSALRLLLVICAALTMASCAGNAVNPPADALTDNAAERCSPDTYRKCATGYDGVCADGEQTCLSSAVWGPCTPAIVPGSQPERCTNNADDDCDGFVDDADMDCVACTPGDSRDCTAIAFGICSDGQQICSDEQTWGVCGPRIRPGSVQEDCGNGLDDDCDNKVDAEDEDCEACTPNAERRCSTGLSGVCAAGTQTCAANSLWGACVPDVAPNTRAEQCANREDDDCDGATDEADTDCQPCQLSDPPQSCATGLPGVCASGTQSCTANHTWGTCNPTIAVGTQPENCNVAGDEDCDGYADRADTDCQDCAPNETRVCNTGLPGVCRDGEQLCKADGTWATGCTVLIQVGARTEDCTNGLDDDCDGAADALDLDSCCVGSETRECDAGNAYCMGTQSCADNTWGGCQLATEAETATGNECDGVDNDCNGVLDNGTYVRGPTLLVEYLPAAVTNRLIGHNGEAFLFGRIGNGAGRWALWDAWSTPVKMLATGDNLEVLLNKLTTGTTFFTASFLSTASAILVGPPGFPNSSCSGGGCLMVFNGSSLKMVNLGTRATYNTTLSAFPWQTTSTTSVRAATGFPAYSFRDANGTPSADSVVVLINGSQCWFWTPSGGVLAATTAVNCLCHPSGTNQSCPSTTTLNNLDGLTYFRGVDNSHNVGIAQGAYHFISPMRNGTAEWAVTYSWSSPIPVFGAYPCDRPAP